MRKEAGTRKARMVSDVAKALPYAFISIADIA
jgi:hypothetical protein